MGEICTPFNSTYAATKAGLTKFSDALRMELAPFNISVVIVKPGGVKSDIANNAKEKTEAYVLCSTSDARVEANWFLITLGFCRAILYTSSSRPTFNTDHKHHRAVLCQLKCSQRRWSHKS